MGEEFDLADAALAQLHVVPGDARDRIGCRDESSTLVFVDAALHRMDVGDSGEVEAAPPDERPDRLEETRAEREVTGHRARLDHGGALPVLAHAFVVCDRGGKGDGGRCDGRIGTQSQVGAEHIAVGVTCLHQRHQAAGNSRREGGHRVALGAFRVYWRRRIVEQHEVHIGGIVQLAGTKLAHAEHREPTAASRILWIGQAQFARVVGGAQQVRGGQTERGLGQIAERSSDALERPDAPDIRDGSGQRDDPLGTPQCGGDAVAAGLGRQRPQFLKRRRHHGVRPARNDVAQAGGFAHRKIGEIGAVAAERAKHSRHRGPCRKPCLGTAQSTESLDQSFRRPGVVRARPMCRKAERSFGHAFEGWP